MALDATTVISESTIVGTEMIDAQVKDQKSFGGKIDDESTV